MRKLKKIEMFRKNDLSQDELKKINAGVNNSLQLDGCSSQRVENVSSGQSPQNGMCDYGFKLDGTFNQYKDDKGWIKC